MWRRCWTGSRLPSGIWRLCGALGGGRLRVGAFPTAVAALVPRALATFHTAHPEVNLSLVEGLTPTLLERLLTGDADVAVVSTPPDRQLDSSAF